MALINTTTTGVLGSTFYGDGAGDLTVQQNGVTVNKITAAPLFHATSGALTFANSTWTKIPFAGKVLDTNNNYDATTNYRFTPTVAGYYWIKAQYFLGTSVGRIACSIYKNNGDVCQTLVLGSNTNGGISVVTQGLISLNGTTDYVEAFGYQESGGTAAMNINGGLTMFSGYMVRAA